MRLSTAHDHRSRRGPCAGAIDHVTGPTRSSPDLSPRRLTTGTTGRRIELRNGDVRPKRTRSQAARLDLRRRVARFAASDRPSGIVAPCPVAVARSQPCRSWSIDASLRDGPVFSMTPASAKVLRISARARGQSATGSSPSGSSGRLSDGCRDRFILRSLRRPRLRRGRAASSTRARAAARRSTRARRRSCCSSRSSRCTPRTARRRSTSRASPRPLPV